MSSAVCQVTPYTLPTIDFIAGSTQNLVFNVYNDNNKMPVDLSSCIVDFSVVNYSNQTGRTDISKLMQITSQDQNINGNVKNILRVELTAADTVELYGKFIYQISIRYASGEMEQKQGLMYIMRNINQKFVN